MTPPPPNGTAEPSRAPAQDPARVVVVVPRKETRLHEYLRRSLAALKNVEVVLDRRAAAVTPPDERRRQQSKDSERKILICSLVRCPVEGPERTTPEPPAPQSESGRHHTLLWPGLRLEHL
jgi:hypothetical protein